MAASARKPPTTHEQINCIFLNWWVPLQVYIEGKYLSFLSSEIAFLDTVCSSFISFWSNLAELNIGLKM